ncbi:hypothetical protein [Parahaliea mediterranea]|uniref:hypothetical protein n=1 Tax=Parahaliea mediterranea TaxID=651086 RepID=UPI000E2ED1F9|nr:hypothetical protein [Parahaliea mediterranea]
MNVLETEWWSLLIPPEWWAEAEDDTILVGDLDDVGCIEISTLHKEAGAFEAAEVAGIARAESPDAGEWRSVTRGDFSGVHCAFVEEGAAVREWYLASGAMLLFITYSCDEENRGMDDAAVDEILDTLLVLNRD